MALEIVSFPIKKSDVPWVCQRLPEGTLNPSQPTLGPIAMLRYQRSATDGSEFSPVKKITCRVGRKNVNGMILCLFLRVGVRKIQTFMGFQHDFNQKQMGSGQVMLAATNVRISFGTYNMTKLLFASKGMC